jgi:hypothetical protein
MAPIAGATFPAATPVAGGSIVGIAPVKASGDAGTADAAPASGRPPTDIDDGSHPVGKTGAAGHGADTDPNRGSFM